MKMPAANFAHTPENEFSCVPGLKIGNRCPHHKTQLRPISVKNAAKSTHSPATGLTDAGKDFCPENDAVFLREA